MGNIVGAIVLGVIAIICFVFSYLQFNEKGFLFNNAYIYASKQERKNMDKKPYYKQSGIVFLLIGIIFLINIIDIILQTIWLVYLVIGPFQSGLRDFAWHLCRSSRQRQP